MKKKVMSAGILILTLALFLSSFSGMKIQGKEAEAVPEELNTLYAQSAVLIDADSGRVLFGKNSSSVRPMASTTKIMTCILALEYADSDAEAVASANAACQPRVRLGITEGERFFLKDLLYSLMLESHNDAAVMIAEAVGGSVEAFAQMMNRKAEEIGCTSTHFVTPNGLDAEDDQGIHSTTAEDLARIMRYCIMISPKKEEFLEITRTMSYVFSNTEGSRSFSCVNHNAFLGMMDGALSGKTGFTNGAGYCYVGALRKDGKTFIVALLGCGWPNHKTYKWSDTKKLMNYGLVHYRYRTVREEIRPEPLPVKRGVPDQGILGGTSLAALYVDEKEVKTLRCLLREDEKVEVRCEIPEYLEAPVEKDAQVGRITYLLGGEVLQTLPVRTETSVDRIGYAWCLRYVLGRFTGRQTGAAE